MLTGTDRAHGRGTLTPPERTDKAGVAPGLSCGLVPLSSTVRSHSRTEMLSVTDRTTHRADVHPTTC